MYRYEERKKAVKPAPCGRIAALVSLDFSKIFSDDFLYRQIVQANELADLARELEPLYAAWDRMTAEMETVLQIIKSPP